MDLDIEELYQEYGPMVLRRCRWILKDEDKAFDAMQDVFVQLLKKKNTLRNIHLTSLLYRIATNICLNRIRYDTRHPETKNENLIHNIAAADDFETRVQLKDLLERIFHGQKESTRTIALLHLVDGMTLQEVANEVGLSVSGVRKRLRTLKAHAELFKE